jgi:succinate-acetate transporter protein
VNDESMAKQLGNPGVFGLATFGFALAALSFQVLLNPEAAGATLYAILVAAIGETIAGMWAIARGNTYIAGVLTTFGIWLFGFYMLRTQGEELGLVNPASEGAYVLLLNIPVIYLAIPAFRGRMWVLSAAFAALIAMLFFLGFGYYFENEMLRTGAGVLALIAAIPIFYLSYEEAAAEGPGAQGG